MLSTAIQFYGRSGLHHFMFRFMCNYMYSTKWHQLRHIKWTLDWEIKLCSCINFMVWLAPTICPFSQVDSCKYLGVVIQSDLKWKVLYITAIDHIRYHSTKANRPYNSLGARCLHAKKLAYTIIRPQMRQSGHPGSLPEVLARTNSMKSSLFCCKCTYPWFLC